MRILWISLYVNDNNLTYFDSFGVEIKEITRNKIVATNVYRIQAHDSIMYLLYLMILC